MELFTERQLNVDSLRGVAAAMAWFEVPLDKYAHWPSFCWCWCWSPLAICRYVQCL